MAKTVKTVSKAYFTHNTLGLSLTDGAVKQYDRWALKLFFPVRLRYRSIFCDGISFCRKSGLIMKIDSLYFVKGLKYYV